MLSFTIDRHTTISDILDNFNGYYSYASGQSFRANRGRGRGKGRNLKEETRYRNEDFRPAVSNPLEVSGLNLYSDD